MITGVVLVAGAADVVEGTLTSTDACEGARDDVVSVCVCGGKLMPNVDVVVSVDTFHHSGRVPYASRPTNAIISKTPAASAIGRNDDRRGRPGAVSMTVTGAAGAGGGGAGAAGGGT